MVLDFGKEFFGIKFCRVFFGDVYVCDVYGDVLFNYRRNNIKC